MRHLKLEARFFGSPDEYDLMLEYFYSGTDSFLRGMGIEPSRLPPREEWRARLLAQHGASDKEVERLYVIWLAGGERVGHSSVSDIRWGEEAFLHLHLWRTDLRKAGAGTEFVRQSARLYWDRLQLKKIYSEPYAHNPAPNRVFEKLGFENKGVTRKVPGRICFEQEVRRWELRTRP
jgi:ribosomal-protein-alanine N-acetyltransferase